MLAFIMILLGLAIFDIARLDARLKIDSQTGVQALEIAEAGLERGLHVFYLEFVCGPNTASPINIANCLNPPTNPNYIIDNTLPLEGVRKALAVRDRRADRRSHPRQRAHRWLAPFPQLSGSRLRGGELWRRWWDAEQLHRARREPARPDPVAVPRRDHSEYPRGRAEGQGRA